MKAAFMTGHGGNEVIEVGDRPTPQRRPGEVLVRMRAATVNRVDLYMRDSGAGITHSLPQIMGVDGAGVIEEADAPELIGRRVTLYPGIVCGSCEFCRCGEPVLCAKMSLLGEHRDGTMAEYVSVPAGNALPIPDRLDFAQAAALGVNYLTAWRMLFTKAKLQPGETVLVFGVGGGVSLAAMQIAAAAGARVLATSRSADKLARARALGADAVIDAPADKIPAAVMDLTGGRGADVVIENIGGAMWSAALKSLVRGGRVATCGATIGDQPPADLRRVFIRQLQIFGSTLGNPSELSDLIAWCDAGKLTPPIDLHYPLGDIRAAFDHLESGSQFGKIAIDI
ncbi:NADPH:quinone reductase [Rhodopseudomonas sp. WA056]|uniref:zinc-binding dehydrogenase n=1 Tax=Rhodopseudomonas sp. WA056 TaxID=2269367 RepID=UPI0013DE8587|nr:zinc-binding dehydrogenase [Rhodopseudomonas sp. WA056]NEW88517.1 NADPH:quinone reductase [Rhodopseudomonas sp. WA056]